MVHIFILIPLIFIAVSLLIRAEFALDQRSIYLLKAPSTLLVGSVAAASLLPGALVFSVDYSVGVLLALGFCLLGDLALMRHENNRFFAAGLGFFLIGQAAYTMLFTHFGSFTLIDLISAAALLGFSVFFFIQFRPGAGKLALPVLIYMLVISAMVNRALGLFNNSGVPIATAGFAVVGAILFWVSDLLLAINRFYRPFRRHRISLAFYYSAQLAFALSTYRF